MYASKQSDEPDSQVVRLEKFRVINRRGHASHSSIQQLMYYDTPMEETTYNDGECVGKVEQLQILSHYEV